MEGDQGGMEGVRGWRLFNEELTEGEGLICLIYATL